jgi:hypothetical protein
MTTEQTKPDERQLAPRSSKKPSSAASNVAQMKAKMETVGEVRSITQTRSEHGFDPKTGEPTLTAIFPREGGREPQHVDISYLLAFPNLLPMFVEAYLCWGASLGARTRLYSRDSLRSHFFSYLQSDWSKMLHPHEIDDEVLAGFKDSLLNKIGRRSRPLHPSTVTSALGALRSVLGRLITGPWASTAQRIAERVPSGPGGTNAGNEPTEVLAVEQLLAILEAAEREVLAIEQRFARAAALLVEGRSRLQDPATRMSYKPVDYGELAICLAAVDELFPGVIPDRKVLEARHSNLAAAVNRIGLRKVVSYFYPCGRELVSFVVLLAIATVFNADTVLSLNWSDIDFDKDQAGTQVIEIIGGKERATRDLVRILDPEAAASSRLSLKQLLACLKIITSRLRPYLLPDHADRLFVYIQQCKVKQPKSFGKDGKIASSPSSDMVWTKALKNFIKDNNLPSFTLGQLRPTILDLVQFMDGSLEAARKIGNHGNPATTWTHYTSGGVKARYRERIGQVIVLRERWLTTEGAIDPRRLPSDRDKGAATPGFSCLDPFDSPRPNQHPGRLCKDYGGCPSCPMAAAHPGDPLSVGYYTALEVAIYRSQGAMSASDLLPESSTVLI